MHIIFFNSDKRYYYFSTEVRTKSIALRHKLKHRYERSVFGLRIAPKAMIVLWLERSPVLITIGMFSEGSKLLLSKRK